jgi:MFS transporter, putative metabolite:H+ symporter
VKNHLYQDQNLLSRLDRIPMTRSVVGLIVLLSFVWLAEAFDIGIVGPVIKVLKESWHLAEFQQSMLAVSSTLGVVCGLLPSGIIADKFGRRNVVIWGIAFFSIVTLIGAFVGNWWELCIVRFVAGIGEGAVIPMPYLLLSEFVQAKRRAVSVGYSNGVLTAAYLVPSLAAVWAIHTFPTDFSWRVPFILGALPLLLIVPLILWLPESPRYLLKVGQQEKVRKLVEKLERQAGLPHDETLINHRVLAVIQHGANRRATLKLLLKPPFLGRGIIVAAQLLGALILFYILQVFGPVILGDKGFASGNAILITGLMMGVGGIGSVFQGYLADKIGRRRTLTLYYLLAAIGCAVFGLFNDTTLILIAGFLTAFFGLGVFPVAKLCVAEQYPTRLRGEGVYLVEMVARFLSGGITLYFIPYLLHQWGNAVIYEGIAIALLVLSMPFVIFGRETAHISVEEAGTELSFNQLDSEVAVLPGTEYNASR